jgi:hypothetical protein
VSSSSGQPRELVVVWGGDGHRGAVLRHLQIGAVAELRDLLPQPQRLRGVAALDGVDADAALLGQREALRVLDIVLIVHVRRRVADQKDHPIGVRVLTPGDGIDRFMQGLVDALRAVAAAVGLELEQLGMQRVEVRRQVHHAA